MLGLLVDPSELPDAILPALAVGLVLLLIARVAFGVPAPARLPSQEAGQTVGEVDRAAEVDSHGGEQQHGLPAGDRRPGVLTHARPAGSCAWCLKPSWASGFVDTAARSGPDEVRRLLTQAATGSV